MAASLDNPQTTVLRVKRKYTEDAFTALIVHTGCAKKSKQDSFSVSEERQKCLFTFAGTLTDGKIESNSELVNKLRTKDFYQHSDLAGKIRLSQRKQCKEKQQISRYKILSQLRQLESNETGEDTTNNKEEDEIQSLYKVYDVIADEMNSKTIESNFEPTADDILCNSVKMIRQNLNISEKRPSSEYVYDIYCAPDAFMMTPADVLDVEEITEDVILYQDNSSDVDEYGDDEDDENAENNWRNDYPDEEEYPSSENEFNPHGDDYVSSDEDFPYDGYRKESGRLMFDPFAVEYNPIDYYDTVDDNDYEHED